MTMHHIQTTTQFDIIKKNSNFHAMNKAT